MIELSRTRIQSIASSEINYARGVQLFKNNRILNPTWSNAAQQYYITVQENYNYTVIIDVVQNEHFNYKCNCSASIGESGACKHVIAALLFILKYQEISQLDKKLSPEEKRIHQIVEYFSLHEDSILVGETFSIELNINIPTMLKNNSSRAVLNLHSGSSKLYKIQSIKKFINDIYLGEDIIIGKEYKFISGESTFDAHSQKILDYLLGIYEVHEVLENSITSKLYNRSELALTQNMLIRLLKIQGEKPFNLHLFGSSYKNVIFKQENPPIVYQLSLQNDSVIVDLNANKPVIPIISSGELLFYNKIIYQPDTEFIKNFQPFYNQLGSAKEPFIFSGKYKQEFLEYVLPVLSNSVKLEIPEDLKDRYITYDLEAEIYFDMIKSAIKAEVRFKYGDYNFNSFEIPMSSQFIIVRQKENEKEIINSLLDKGFMPYKNYFILKNDEQIYNFILDGVLDLQEKAHLFYTNSFRNLNINTIGRASTNINLNLDINMLEVDFAFDNIPKEELKDLFHSFKIKKRYYRLKNGTFINLENNDLEEITQIFKNLGISYKDFNSEHILINKNKAVYMDKVLTDSDFEYKKSKSYENLVDKILNPITSDYLIPDQIESVLKPYQVTGFKWLKTLASNELGGILADDMGLGKTLQAISYISSNLKDVFYLIVCPSSLIYNWQDEIENFAPFIKAVVINGTPEERKKTIQSYKKYNVLITSYPLIRRDIKSYLDIEFDTVFIDEAQYIKNDTSLSSKAVKLLNSKHRFALTGTPIENNLSELWSIFDFVMPDYLYSHSKFSELYEKPILKDDFNILNDLNKKIAPFILRRMKKDVLTELPDKYERKIVTDLTDEQKKVYQSYLINLKNELQSEMKDNISAQSRIKVLAALTRLRQICCHPSTFIENYEGGSGKLDLLMEILPDAIANDHRVLVFSQFTSMLKIIEKELIKYNIPYFFLQGSTTSELRNEYVKRFNHGEGKVFLISLKAGGTGLNLTGADMVIHYDPWWNPAVEEQATDRAYRIGQQNKVEVIKLLSKGTIEEKIYKLQKRKKELLNNVINSKEVFINTLSQEELEDLFN